MLSFSSEHFQLQFYKEKSTKLHEKQNVKKKIYILCNYDARSAIQVIKYIHELKKKILCFARLTHLEELY